MYTTIDTPAHRIAQAMEDKGLKQSDIIRRTGINSGALSSYLSGRYEPKQETLYKLGQVLDVSEMWLAGYDVPKERTDAQKENDALAAIMQRARQDESYKDLIVKIEKLNAEQINLLSMMADQLLASINKE